MMVSYQWLSDYVDLKGLSSQKIAETLTNLGLEVEAVSDLSKGLENVVTAHVEKISPHPNADRLRICQVNNGKKTQEVVCGAQNVKEGDKVIFAQVGANLPNGLEIKLSKIRDVTSNGMLCSEDELGLGKNSQGIIILPKNITIGKPAAKALGREDTLFELGITPDRGDCLSHWGIARELAASLNRKLIQPKTKLLNLKGSPIKTKTFKDGPQFFGCLIEGVKIGPSPTWLVQRLEAIGSRSVNNVVDATNFVLFELGQPTHAYDADKLQSKSLGIANAKKGDKLSLLDGSVIDLNGTELVITDKGPVALAGVMGGGTTEVSESTHRIFLECAQFDPVRVRKSASAHQIKSDASHRFERGIDGEGLHFAISRLANLIVEIASSPDGKFPKIVGSTKSKHASYKKHPAISVAATYFEEFLGMDVKPIVAKKILMKLGCKVVGSTTWKVTPPSYRNDLSIKPDLAEEIARSIGYDKIPSTIPPLTGLPVTASESKQAEEFLLLQKAKEVLSRLGLNESLNYSWTSKKWLKKFGMQEKAGVPITNPLSEDQEVLVPSLLPNLVEAALANWNHHFGSDALPIRLFEIRPTFHIKEGSEIKAHDEYTTGVDEKWKLAFVLSGPALSQSLRNETKPVDFFDVKAVLEHLFGNLGTKGLRFQKADSSFHLLHPGKSATIQVGNHQAGSIGLSHPSLSQDLKLRAPLWLCEVDWSAILELTRSITVSARFKAWSPYPTIERDFAIVVKDDVTADKITQIAQRAARPIAKNIKVFDIYKGSQVLEGMTSVAVRVIFSYEGRSLQEFEADDASQKILASWKKELGAELRS